MATDSRKNPYFRPAREGGPVGRGHVSPLGGRSNPDRNDLQLPEERRNRAQAKRTQEPFGSAQPVGAGTRGSDGPTNHRR
jgi:hypothetical protein